MISSVVTSMVSSSRFNNFKIFVLFSLTDSEDAPAPPPVTQCFNFLIQIPGEKVERSGVVFLFLVGGAGDLGGGDAI